MLWVFLSRWILYSQNPYGFSVFVILPFLAGMVVALIYGVWPSADPIALLEEEHNAAVLRRTSELRHKRRKEVLDATWLAMAFACVLALVFLLEGIICIGMLAPLEIPLALAGALVGHWLIGKTKAGQRMLHGTFLALLPVAMALSGNSPPDTFETSVTTSVIIAAPPEVIWPYLFDLDALPPPKNLLFRAGVAHPQSVWSAAREVGALRECRLSTGVMPERISAIEPGRRMRFEVLATPASMREWNPFGEVDARHLHGYYECVWGEFRLTPLTNGSTRVEGTSAYRLRMEPVAYLRLWTDRIVHGIHDRVLDEIKRRAEEIPQG